MNAISVTAYISIALGVLLIVLAVPLILRKVPMNGVYGVRFCASFKSDWLWYEINEYGGKVMVYAAIPFLAYGLYGVLASPGALYIHGHTVLTVVDLLVLLILSYARAKKLEKEYDKLKQEKRE